MACVCMYFQIHQPYRLKRYSVFDTDADYFDAERDAQIVERVAHKCYLPATRAILELVRRYQGRFRVAYSMTGCIVEQLQQHCPQIIELLQELGASGSVEFLGETYYHSMAFLYSHTEFAEQIELHAELMENLFGQRPAVFRNTELIYSNELAKFISATGRYRGILAEGADHILSGRSPNCLYRPPGCPDLKLLLKNYRLSDDIAFRFSNEQWAEWPLTADKFAKWVSRIDRDSASAKVCNLFMDYETFGEHQWKETGIFTFLNEMPEKVLKLDHCAFHTPSECMDMHDTHDEYDVPHAISWADTERDLSAWLGNAMQSNALYELYQLEQAIKDRQHPDLLSDWRKLTTSDHFYYMCTKYFADGDVHKYFNPYESPYDSYINFMNVLDNLRTRAGLYLATPLATKAPLEDTAVKTAR